jgi:hypothetical protein
MASISGFRPDPSSTLPPAHLGDRTPHRNVSKQMWKPYKFLLGGAGLSLYIISKLQDTMVRRTSCPHLPLRPQQHSSNTGRHGWYLQNVFLCCRAAIDAIAPYTSFRALSLAAAVGLKESNEHELI